MKKLIDPAQFGLYPKTVIEELSKNHFALVITRKSRIIMSDGNRILERKDKEDQEDCESKSENIRPDMQ
jgi:hypothetical protein